jgi:methyltransferase OMS1, mitochondrial
MRRAARQPTTTTTTTTTTSLPLSRIRPFSTSQSQQGRGSRRIPPQNPPLPPAARRPAPPEPPKPSEPEPLPSRTAAQAPWRRKLTKEERLDSRYHFFTLLFGTVFFTGLFFYGTSYYNLIQNVPVPAQEELDSIDLESVWKHATLQTGTDQARTVDTSEAAKVKAENYDDEINTTEWMAGLTKLRKQMIQEAHGHVLESAAGTGRNSDYYAQVIIDNAKSIQTPPNADGLQHSSPPLHSVTMVDVSKGMLLAAKEKWEKIINRPSFQQAGGLSMRMLMGDLAAEDFSDVDKIFGGGRNSDSAHPSRFDTIIQTNGLCSTKHPLILLRNLAKLVKPDGKIILLEHGRSSYDFVNQILDRTALDHAKKHGCLWNRDIEQLVKDSGLQIEFMKRTNLGTHYYIVLKPTPPKH